MQQEKQYMNLATGEVCSRGGWIYEDENGKEIDPVLLGDVVIVEKVNGQWVEV